jgi:hypothetical protein
MGVKRSCRLRARNDANDPEEAKGGALIAFFFLPAGRISYDAAIRAASSRDASEIWFVRSGWLGRPTSLVRWMG